MSTLAGRTISRRSPQFSVRTLLLGITGLSIFIALAVQFFAPARQQREAVNTIERFGGGIAYTEPEWRESWPTSVLRNFLPRYNFDWVVKVNLQGTRITDAHMAPFSRLAELEELQLSETKITGAGLVHLQGLGELREVWLTRTPISDADMVQIASLTQLRSLWLNGTRLTDEGLVYLKPLRGLHSLRLGGTGVTNRGLVHLKGLAKLQWLGLEDTQVTDIAFVGFGAMPQLRMLCLKGSQVTLDAASLFEQTHPDCCVADMSTEPKTTQFRRMGFISD